MPQKPDNDRPAAPRPPKRPYLRPRLVRYGDVTQLTRTAGPGGPKKDSPGLSKSRTK